ncbi:nitronate monooxygenase [Aspergillus clavatus NRRL 1]|uniref:Oxidoreductase, 2-nitropropane dioxygenase family, putative n=1 Tax=Aspergillus clavatus (strain ATCC 1007 / CBS 513.65 / DSM 816 / NCTC 3887 / NRRL 1 / QM 1276 / 107) TaxID=344612 RepID=A1CD72_ASPCL|nr:oxidoreductase, 2-nitropropane dioxygenase family, putative [Aspergillus clavatus NRRL 1]EAW11799.1 oxidoreductase, 2-nitropropane dioxygenase family, putative [Aspergillus clavatus NRRL 1]
MLKSTYSWTKCPLVASAPMLNIAMAPLAVSVSAAGGLGFLAAGFDVSNLEKNLEDAVSLVKQSSGAMRQAYDATGILPIGVGFINWGADLTRSIAAIQKYRPCAVWLFGPTAQPDDLVPWVDQVRNGTSGETQIWVQVGTVGEAVAVAETLRPDVLVVQGSDAGGHGLAQSASILTLVPEVRDALRERNMTRIAILAAGGIVDGRGIAAALALGAVGGVMGTRFLASAEANIARGYQKEVLRVSDGGISTVRSTVYDRVRGIGGWPRRYDGRGVINESYHDAAERGMDDAENRRLYQEELKKGDAGWGPQGRMTTYAGTGVGLVREILPASTIVANTLAEARDTIQGITID